MLNGCYTRKRDSPRETTDKGTCLRSAQRVALGIGLSSMLIKILPDGWKDVVIDSIIATEGMNVEQNRRVYRGWNTEGPPPGGPPASAPT